MCKGVKKIITNDIEQHYLKKLLELNPNVIITKQN